MQDDSDNNFSRDNSRGLNAPRCDELGLVQEAKSDEAENGAQKPKNSSQDLLAKRDSPHLFNVRRPVQISGFPSSPSVEGGTAIQAGVESKPEAETQEIAEPQPVENGGTGELGTNAAPVQAPALAPVKSAGERPRLTLVSSAPSSTGKPVPASTGEKPRSSTGAPVLESFSKWKKTQADKPPCPEGYELDKKGGRKIGRKTYFGYNFLRVETCPECGGRTRRPVIGYISATALWRLLQRDYEIQKRLIKIHLSERARRKPYHLSRCADCVARDRSEAIGA